MLSLSRRTCALLSPWAPFAALLLMACEAPQRLPVDAASAEDLDAGRGGDTGGPAFVSDGGDAGPSENEGPCGLGAPRGDEGLMLGTGRDAFRPICSGDSFDWVEGQSNGGGHLEGAIRLEAELLAGLSQQEQDDIQLELSVLDFVTSGRATDPARLAGADLRPGPDGSLQTFNVILFIDGRGVESAYELLFDPGPLEEIEFGLFDGRRFIYEARVDLPDGRVLSRTATVTSRCCG